MSLPLDLLEQAYHLAFREKKRPKQASLRRSVSTAYYALFHHLVAEALQLIAPNVGDGSRYIMQRWFNHDEMRRACGIFSASSLTGPVAALMGTAPSADLQLIARAFVQLQGSRHSADYDLASNWTRLKSQQHVQIARDAFAAWGRVRKSAEANIFALGLLDLKRLQTERK